MRILVIGGTLFIGRAIVKRLAGRRHEVSVLHRRDDSFEDRLLAMRTFRMAAGRQRAAPRPPARGRLS